MKKNLLLLTFLYSVTCFSTLVNASNRQIVINNLKVEYIETPLGIDVEKPRFSWQMQSDENGVFQTAYQVIVVDEKEKEVWNSGKVKSDLSLNIIYAGVPLKPMTRYRWEVTLWDQKKKKHTSQSWFETGLMNSDLSAWDGAQWIGGSEEDLILYSHYLPVFRIDYTLQLDEETQTTRAGFVYGANDERLMNKNRNIFGLESKQDESYFMLELDISPLALNEKACLNLFRVGYHPMDRKDQPLKSFSIPLSLINNENKYQKQVISVASNLGHTNIFVNQTEIAYLGVNPLGQGGDFIAFPVVGDIGFSVPAGQKTVFSDIIIRNFRAPSNVLVRESGAIVEGREQGAFMTHNPSRNSMPMLRTTFRADDSVAKARLYVTARGIYDFYINGKRIGADYFNPGSTQYNKTQMYQTFDVTEQLQTGKNAMGAVLAEGWWSGGATFMGEYWNFFGDRQSLLAKLAITYSDGKEEVIVTNPDRWQYFNDGPVVYGSFFQGEVYDALKESDVNGWSTSAYDASAWKKVYEIPLQETISFNTEDFNQLKLIGEYGETVKVVKELTAQSVEEIRPGVFVYDMGQNMVGVPCISFTNLREGQKINLRFAEVKYPDLPASGTNVGMIMLENIRAAMSQDIYIAKGGIERFQPRFTFHGYRFIEITGIEKPLPVEAVKGVVLSSVYELASSYETSNVKINKLWENITWSMSGNFLSIPTDCPQRNERLGWSGDISVFARAATYLADVPQFLRRHMLAMRDAQRANGRFPDIAPLDVGFGGILWGSAGITVAWESYQQYHDVAMLEEHYDAMKRYIDYLLFQIDSETNIVGDGYRGNWGSLGDWLSPEYDKSEKSLLWESYLIYDLELMEKIASVLQKTEEAQYFKKIYTERKSFFNKAYIDQETAKTIYPDNEQKIIDTQVSYVLPLVFNIIDERYKEKFIENLVIAIERENISDDQVVCPPYSLMTGFIGTSWISKALSDNGHTDVAYKLLQQTTYPSWLYSVEQGATTIWERLNSYTHTEGFSGGTQMNSFNHYSFGAVAAWMYNYSLGIERDEYTPGFKHFYLKPEIDPTGGITFAKGHYDSMYGRIYSAWAVEGDVTHYQFSVPANTTATLKLKASSIKKIRENGKPISSNKYIRNMGKEGDKYVFKLQSGNYLINVRNN